jgi:hypothetical protein
VDRRGGCGAREREGMIATGREKLQQQQQQRWCRMVRVRE